ncbi:MAG: hypothetical protein Q9181_005978 [Wetmoreana brouardii]
MSHINAATRRYLAELINKELIDIISFQSHTGVPDNNGIRPSTKDILKQRWEREKEAIQDFLAQLKSSRGDSKSPALDEPESAVQVPRANSDPSRGPTVLIRALIATSVTTVYGSLQSHMTETYTDDVSHPQGGHRVWGRVAWGISA